LPLLYLGSRHLPKSDHNYQQMSSKVAREFNPNELANFALNQFVKQVSG